MTKILTFIYIKANSIDIIELLDLVFGKCTSPSLHLCSQPIIFLSSRLVYEGRLYASTYLKLDSNNNCFPLNKAPSMMAAMIQLAFVLKQLIFPKETPTAVEKLKMSIFETSCFLLFSKYGLSRASTHPPSERQVMGTNRERTMSQTISLVLLLDAIFTKK